MPQHYDKLVRDRIPEIIRREGRACATEVMPEVAFRLALRDKLVEEAREAAAAEGDDLITELADLREVIDALLATYRLDGDRLIAIQEQRRAERGGFTARLRLLSVGE